MEHEQNERIENDGRTVCVSDGSRQDNRYAMASSGAGTGGEERNIACGKLLADTASGAEDGTAIAGPQAPTKGGRVKGRKRERKTRRMGSIVERSPGRFLIRVYVGRDSTGRRHDHCETIRGTATAARARLQEIIRKHQSGEPLRLGADTFDAFFCEWLDANRATLKEASIASYERAARIYIRPTLGSVMLTRIDSAMIEKLFRTMREKGLSGSTVSYVSTLLKAVFRMAIERRKIAYNPMATIKAQAAGKAREAGAMTAEQIGQFLDAAEGGRFGTLFFLGFHLGTRPGEMLGLKWADIDQAAQTVTIRRTITWRRPQDAKAAGLPLWYLDTPKTKLSRRTLPLSPAVVERLQAHRRAQLEDRMKAGRAWTENDFIFADETGGPYSQARLRVVFKGIAKAAGLPKGFNPYSCRHSTATLLMSAGVNPKIVSERLGHSTVSITLGIYSHVMPGMQAAASVELERIIAAKKA
ncbi:MAG: site-specific integrase [Blastocatellia bacterium]|nr:site-specific integrase [Blastocatellia bacterium]